MSRHASPPSPTQLDLFAVELPDSEVRTPVSPARREPRRQSRQEPAVSRPKPPDLTTTALASLDGDQRQVIEALGSALAIGAIASARRQLN